MTIELKTNHEMQTAAHNLTTSYQALKDNPGNVIKQHKLNHEFMHLLKATKHANPELFPHGAIEMNEYWQQRHEAMDQLKPLLNKFIVNVGAKHGITIPETMDFFPKVQSLAG